MATTNNIGLYCFDTGNEDAKTSLEALFGAGNSNMKKIDDAIGDLKKKSFIVNTEAELNALLTEENLGKTVSFNGELYIITEGGSSSNAPIAEDDTIDKLYFNTSVEPDLSGFEFNEGVSILANYRYDKGSNNLMVYDLQTLLSLSYPAYCLFAEVNIDADTTGAPIPIYSTTDFNAGEVSATQGWQNLTDGAVSLGESLTVTEVNQQDLWSSYISKEPFTSGGIIAKPVGAEGGGLPSFAPEDAGKFLRVDSNGNIVAEAIAYAEGESF